VARRTTLLLESMSMWVSLPGASPHPRRPTLPKCSPSPTRVAMPAAPNPLPLQSAPPEFPAPKCVRSRRRGALQGRAGKQAAPCGTAAWRKTFSQPWLRTCPQARADPRRPRHAGCFVPPSNAPAPLLTPAGGRCAGPRASTPLPPRTTLQRPARPRRPRTTPPIPLRPPRAACASPPGPPRRPPPPRRPLPPHPRTVCAALRCSALLCAALRCFALLCARRAPHWAPGDRGTCRAGCRSGVGSRCWPSARSRLR